MVCFCNKHEDAKMKGRKKDNKRIKNEMSRRRISCGAESETETVHEGSGIGDSLLFSRTEERARDRTDVRTQERGDVREQLVLERGSRWCSATALWQQTKEVLTRLWRERIRKRLGNTQQCLPVAPHRCVARRVREIRRGGCYCAACGRRRTAVRAEDLVPDACERPERVGERALCPARNKHARARIELRKRVCTRDAPVQPRVGLCSRQRCVVEPAAL